MSALPPCLPRLQGTPHAALPQLQGDPAAGPRIACQGHAHVSGLGSRRSPDRPPQRASSTELLPAAEDLWLAAGASSPAAAAAAAHSRPASTSIGLGLGLLAAAGLAAADHGGYLAASPPFLPGGELCVCVERGVSGGKSQPSNTVVCHPLSLPGRAGIERSVQSRAYHKLNRYNYYVGSCVARPPCLQVHSPAAVFPAATPSQRAARPSSSPADAPSSSTRPEAPLPKSSSSSSTMGARRLSCTTWRTSPAEPWCRKMHGHQQRQLRA
jgi:hypothetical protein